MANYAIISVGGKQYVVKEGEHLLVDHLDRDEGKSFQPDVLFLGGDGGGELAPSATVTARVVGHERGPKIRIGKYKAKSGYKRHNGFRSSLTRIEITGIGARTTNAKADPEPAAPEAEEAPAAPTGLPEGYADLTVAEIASASKEWDDSTLQAAQTYEQEHANRKGALAAIETALAAKEES